LLSRTSQTRDRLKLEIPQAGNENGKRRTSIYEDPPSSDSDSDGKWECDVEVRRVEAVGRREQQQ
jgi:hypothetical protein